MKTLHDLFILEGMKECTVLAGHKGLDRSVQFVNISDAPDIIHYLKAHHLLLTTGFAFKDNPQEMRHLIRQMHAMNCSGIVIKIDRFMNKLPAHIKHLADELSFPILDLTSNHTLGDLSRHILNYLNDHEAEQLYHALHVQEAFSKMMIKGFGIDRLIDQLEYFLDRPVLLLNHRGEKTAQSRTFRNHRDTYDETAILSEIKNDLQSSRNGRVFSLQAEGSHTILTFPVQTKRQFPSILAIMDAESLPYPSSQMAIEQAGNVISFTIIKEQAIEENARLLKNNFFADLIEKRLHSENEILSRANYYGMEKDMENICAVCTVDPAKVNDETLQLYERRIAELHHHIYDRLEDEIAYQDMQATLFTKAKYFVLIIQFPKYSDHELNLTTSFFERARNNISQEYPVSFGISNAVHSLMDIPKAYLEATEAVQNGYERQMTNFVNFYKTREIEELLGTLPRKDLQALYENTMKSLAYASTKENIEMVRTIEVYLNCQCEIAASARKLFVHRNTVKYRIAKSEELLNCSFSDPQDSLRIRVAIVIGKILQENVM